MTSDSWQRAWATLPARPRRSQPPWPEPAWQPDDAAMRRRVRWETAGHVVIGALWLGSLLWYWHDGELPEDDPFLPVVWLLLVAIRLAQVHVPGWRDGYRRQLRDDLRVRHALRAHLDVGAAHRGDVSDRARLRRWGIPVLLLGYPVVGGLLLAGLLPGDAVDVVLSVLIGAGYVAGLLVWPRQWREARRWLADPLPRVEAW